MSCPSSIWCRDLNPQPLERESPPITTRPGSRPPNKFVKILYRVPIIKLRIENQWICKLLHNLDELTAYLDYLVMLVNSFYVSSTNMFNEHILNK